MKEEGKEKMGIAEENDRKMREGNERRDFEAGKGGIKKRKVIEENERGMRKEEN